MATYHDDQYIDLMNHVLIAGTHKLNRTNVSTYSVFGCDMRFDLSDQTIPLLTTKRMHWSSVVHELLWYISGSTNNNDLEQNGVRIWREWADETGDLGPLYGYQLRNWNGKIDQLQEVISILKKDPDSRRMVVSYWNPEVLPLDNISPKYNPKLGRQALAPCHYTWQLYTIPFNSTRKLSMKLTQRSADVFLGVPFNIAQYSILLHMLCHITGYVPGDFLWSGGDVHIYANHLEQCHQQIRRHPTPSPTLHFARPVDDMEKFTYNDFILGAYDPHPPIKATVAV